MYKIILANSFPQACTTLGRKTLGKVYNCYFPETILKQFWYYMVAYNLGTQIEGLQKLVPVIKRKLLVSYENW